MRKKLKFDPYIFLTHAIWYCNEEDNIDAVLILQCARRQLSLVKNK
jgi:hypothetical protein